MWMRGSKMITCAVAGKTITVDPRRGEHGPGSSYLRVIDFCLGPFIHLTVNPWGSCPDSPEGSRPDPSEALDALRPVEQCLGGRLRKSLKVTNRKKECQLYRWSLSELPSRGTYVFERISVQGIKSPAGLMSTNLNQP